MTFFKGLMIVLFLSKTMTAVLYSLAYENLTATPTLTGRKPVGRKMHALYGWLESFYQKSQ